MYNVKPSRMQNIKMRLLLKTAPKPVQKHVQDRIEELETKLISAYRCVDQLQSDNMSLEMTINCLLVDQQHADEVIEELRYKLDMAVRANEWNASTVDFIFPERDTSDFEDQATAPIDLRELYATLEEITKEKVIAVDPSTGIASTVEVQIPEQPKPYRVSRIREVQRGEAFASPTHIPGMKVS